MPAIHFTNWRAGWLYETATVAAPTVWTAVDTSQDLTYTADNELILRVTADAAQYDTTAYIVEAVNNGLDHVVAQTVKLDVPSGNGNFRADYFSLDTTLGTYGQVASTNTVEAGHHRARFAYEQQVELERSLGCIFDYSGTLFRGVESGRTDTKQLEEGGLLEGYDVTITTSRKQWADNDMRPLVGAVLTRGGKRFKVETVVTNDGAFELGLMKKHG